MFVLLTKVSLTYYDISMFNYIENGYYYMKVKLNQ
jgi:hypothetical protein